MHRTGNRSKAPIVIQKGILQKAESKAICRRINVGQCGRRVLLAHGYTETVNNVEHKQTQKDQAYWRRVTEYKQFPADALALGRDADGATLFAARIDDGGGGGGGGEVLVGKCRWRVGGHAAAAAVFCGGSAGGVRVVANGGFDVLCGAFPGVVKLVAQTGFVAFHGRNEPRAGCLANGKPTKSVLSSMPAVPSRLDSARDRSVAVASSLAALNVVCFSEVETCESVHRFVLENSRSLVQGTVSSFTRPVEPGFLLLFMGLPNVVMNGVLDFVGILDIITLAQTNKKLRAFFGSRLLSESLAHLPKKSPAFVPKTMGTSLSFELWNNTLSPNNTQHQHPPNSISTESTDSALSSTIALIQFFVHAYCAVLSDRISEIPDEQHSIGKTWKQVIREEAAPMVLQTTLVANRMKPQFLNLSKDMLRIASDLNGTLNVGQIRGGGDGGCLGLLPFDVAIFLRWFLFDFQRLANLFEYEVGALETEDGFNLGILELPDLGGKLVSQFSEVYTEVPILDGPGMSLELDDEIVLWNNESAEQEDDNDDNNDSDDNGDGGHVQLLLRLFPALGGGYGGYQTRFFVDCTIGSRWFGHSVTSSEEHPGKYGASFYKAVLKWGQNLYFSDEIGLVQGKE
ncbi:hypothetical protein HK100_009358 [Physocladia obscura]|uniref:F-box domain-containing protein n=1 Tax=Physocladia obscura TaxID=109957 RepID=A0AAD5T421_9FUNG|nr:hypothetical protein HK100_009358 [Physocladia obscura]